MHWEFIHKQTGPGITAAGTESSQWKGGVLAGGEQDGARPGNSGLPCVLKMQLVHTDPRVQCCGRGGQARAPTQAKFSHSMVPWKLPVLRVFKQRLGDLP